MADTSDVLLKMIEEGWSLAKQSEDQRATMTNYIIVISAAIFGFIMNKGIAKEVWPLSVLLVMLGIYGAIISAKLYERFKLHEHIVIKIIQRLDELHPDAQLQQLVRAAEKEHNTKFRLVRLRLNWLWLVLHITIALLGVAITVIAVIR